MCAVPHVTNTAVFHTQSALSQSNFKPVQSLPTSRRGLNQHKVPALVGPTVKLVSLAFEVCGLL